MWGVLMIMLPVLIWGIYGVAAVRILSERQVPHDVSDLRRDYGLTVAEVTRLEQELNESRHVQDLFHGQACSVVLGALAEVIPAEVEVATCAIQVNPADGSEWRLVLTGQSNSHTVLGDFAEKLESHNAFKKVAMTLSRASQLPGVPSEAMEKPLSGFRIECAVQRSGGSA